MVAVATTGKNLLKDLHSRKLNSPVSWIRYATTPPNNSVTPMCLHPSWQTSPASRLFVCKIILSTWL